MDPNASWTPGKYCMDRNISTSPKFGKVDTCLGEKDIWPGLFERSINSLLIPGIDTSYANNILGLSDRVWNLFSSIGKTSFIILGSYPM